MAVNSTHAEFDATALAWARARDVIAGEDAVKAAGESYLPRLESQTDDEFAAYKQRASFFNATARTGEAAAGRALRQFSNDVDLLGTSLFGYAKNVVAEVVGVGRAGSLVDWESAGENRVYATLYRAETILNWRTQRLAGRNVLTLLVLAEKAEGLGADRRGGARCRVAGYHRGRRANGTRPLPGASLRWCPPPAGDRSLAP